MTSGVVKGRTIRKVMGGRVGGVFQLFFSLTACAGIFFTRTPLHEFFFSDNIAFFLNSEILIHYLCFSVLYKLFYTHNRSKDTAHFIQHIFENVHTVREEEATWSERLIFIFLL